MTFWCFAFLPLFARGGRGHSSRQDRRTRASSLGFVAEIAGRPLHIEDANGVAIGAAGAVCPAGASRPIVQKPAAPASIAIISRLHVPIPDPLPLSSSHHHNNDRLVHYRGVLQAPAAAATIMVSVCVAWLPRMEVEVHGRVVVRPMRDGWSIRRSLLV